MYGKGTMALAVAAALGLPHAARAQTQDELRTLREQVKQLDGRVTDAEQAVLQASSRPASESAMNPAVSLILNGIYSNLSQDPNGFRINGFVPTLGEVGPPVRGLSLGESELAFAANIDHYFRGTLIASISPDNSDRRGGGLHPDALPVATGSRSRRGGSSPAWATRTRFTRTPGISPTHRSRTRCFSATS